MAITVFYILYILVTNRTTVTATIEEAKNCLENEIVTNDCSLCEFDCSRCSCCDMSGGSEDDWIYNETISQHILNKPHLKIVEGLNTEYYPNTGYYPHDYDVHSYSPNCGGSKSTIAKSKTNGLHWDSINSKYFYRGNVGNNYVYIESVDRFYRIVDFDSNYIRIITEQSIPLKISSSNTNFGCTVQELLYDDACDFKTPESLFPENILSSDFLYVYHDIEVLSYTSALLAGGYDWYEDTDGVDVNPNYLNDGTGSQYTALYDENGKYCSFGSIIRCYTSSGDRSVSNIRPVITLNVDNIIFKGNGTVDDPYVFDRRY